MSKLEGADKKLLKWIAVASAVIGLIIGISQVTKLIVKWKEEREKVKSLVASARLQNSSGDYAGAWDTLEQAHAIRPSSDEVQSERANTAMLWLRNIHLRGERGEKRFSDITDKLVPVLYDKAASSQGKEKADALAHIGWANYLKFRDGANVMPEENFMNALASDSGNVYAHTMWGFWMLFPGSNSGNVTEAKAHFASAKANADADLVKYVRQLELWAFRNGNTDLQYEPEIIALINEMRIIGDSLSYAERNRIVTDAYYADEVLLDSILARLTPEEHLQTFFYLTEGINMADRLYLQFIHALLLEKLEDYKGAIAIYDSIASHKSYGGFKYKNKVGDGIRRLSHYR